MMCNNGFVAIFFVVSWSQASVENFLVHKWSPSQPKEGHPIPLNVNAQPTMQRIWLLEIFIIFEEEKAMSLELIIPIQKVQKKN